MTKLEECARALAADFWDSDPSPYDPNHPIDRQAREDYINQNWVMFYSAAAAVIRCLMEPNEAMVTKCFRIVGINDCGPAEVRDGIRAMLQSVLDEAGKE